MILGTFADKTEDVILKNGGESMSLSSAFKGRVGEMQGIFATKIRLDSKIYRLIHNVTIPTKNGTTQIDQVLISKYGIFVIEEKNFKGWIYGGEKQPKWTQALFGSKYQFQNPLFQNYRHTKALADFLNINHSKIHSVVMFRGDSVFKTPMPPNVLDRGFSAYIKSKQEILFNDQEVDQIYEAIQSGRLPKGWRTKREHLNSIQEKLSGKTICPKCGGSLVLRTAGKGKNTGSQFYGCGSYPVCKYTTDIKK